MLVDTTSIIFQLKIRELECKQRIAEQEQGIAGCFKDNKIFFYDNKSFKL